VACATRFQTMARFTSFAAGRETVDALAARWRDECLIRDGSLLFDDRRLWTAEALGEFHQRFVTVGAETGASFGERLGQQLATASNDLRWLAAEILIVYALPVTGLLGAPGKRQLVQQALGSFSPQSAPHWNEVERAFDEGIGNPGAPYNVDRGRQIRYLLDFVERLKQLTPDDRGRLLDDPWRLMAFADAVDPGSRGAMRHVVLHLLRPNEFERIFSGGHKQQVAEAFAAEVEQAGIELPPELDRRLFAIRQALDQRRVADTPPVDFYISPYEEQWRSPAQQLDDSGSDGASRWFWVNQGQTWKAERDEGILWAPLRSKNGLRLHHWERMDELQPGDTVLHYSGAIRAVSTVTKGAAREPKPAVLRSDAWEEAGRLVRADYVELQQPIMLNEIPAPWRTAENGGPFTSTGSVQQGYLFPLSTELATRLVARFDELRDAIKGPVPLPPDTASLSDTYSSLQSAVADSGLLVPAERVQALMAAIVAKPFVILAGLSGSGKTQLGLRLGEWLSAAEIDRSLVVAVRPDWTGPESLFGYEDALRPPSEDGRAAWYVPPTLEFILEASRDPEHAYLLVLDEMNLAHVERYFSDFLSGFESGEPVLPNLERSDGVWRSRPNERRLIEVPKNLLVIGTVNVDETTYLFSPKVLDRAFTFEIRTGTEELTVDLRKPTPLLGGDDHILRSFAQAAQDSSWHLEHPHPERDRIARALENLHAGLAKSGDEFGHRVFYEALRFAAILADMGERDADTAIDYIALLKILPRIHGSRRRVEPVLRRLIRFSVDPSGTLDGGDDSPPSARDVRLPRTRAKVDRMLAALQANQFVSFSE
jgi:5-methylcytosine-specific restriction enzyme B